MHPVRKNGYQTLDLNAHICINMFCQQPGLWGHGGRNWVAQCGDRVFGASGQGGTEPRAQYMGPAIYGY